MNENPYLYALAYFPQRDTYLATHVPDTPVTSVVAAPASVYIKQVTEVTMVKIPFIEHRIENPTLVVTTDMTGLIVQGTVAILPDTKSVIFSTSKPFSGTIKISS